MTWVIASPLLFLGLVGHLLTLATGISILRQCLASRTYRHSSGLPLVGPLFFGLAYALVRTATLLWLAGLLLTLEILLGVVITLVMRRTGATPRTD